MSVVMFLRIKADPKKFEEYAQQNGDLLKKITEDAKSKGALHH